MRSGRHQPLIRAALFLLILFISWAFAAFLQSSSLGNWLEQRTYDLRFKLRGSLPPSPQAPVVILGIDEESTRRIPEPLLLWQKHFARVLTELVRAEAAAVGIDWIFRDVSSLDPEGQRDLFQALLTAQGSNLPVVLAYQAGAVLPPPLGMRMIVGEAAFAFANLTTDDDDFVRRQRLSGGSGESLRPGFALAVAGAFAAGRRQSLILPSAKEAAILINYRGTSAFRKISFADALDAAAANDSAFFSKHFQHQIVLVAAILDEDLHPTPLYYWERPPRQSGLSNPNKRRTHGVEIHANTIATLLEGNAIRLPSTSMQTALTITLLLLICLVCYRFPPVWSIPVSLLLAGGYVIYATYWAFASGWWLYLVSPVGGCLCALALTILCDYFREGREKRRLRSLFGRYVSDQVIEKILQAPEEMALQGVRKHIAVLFADIRDFTAQSHGKKPRQVVTFLNRYLPLMVNAIQGRGGMVDKFMGDGIMAVFGAPLEDRACALNAVKAAQGMLKKLAALNCQLESEGNPPVRIGIGIHSGDAVVGNIGCPSKMEYTAIGDVVNTASRIEGLTKVLKAEILISAAVQEAIGNSVEVVFAGEQKVKGIECPISIYRVPSKSNCK